MMKRTMFVLLFILISLIHSQADIDINTSISEQETFQIKNIQISEFTNPNDNNNDSKTNETDISTTSENKINEINEVEEDFEYQNEDMIIDEFENIIASASIYKNENTESTDNNDNINDDLNHDINDITSQSDFVSGDQLSSQTLEEETDTYSNAYDYWAEPVPSMLIMLDEINWSN
ncbi:hypothetical protein Glove_9g266 [Diversispora epigaea]|uniref:Secreted protein n=1 Tax=Diversispora epigaea TaxID=1348612 RepID=A0A397JZF6_9GLOM|nr:hypothetical protein Glove_9g266 [Diversispora epigaea]